MVRSTRGEGVAGEPHSLSHMVEWAQRLEKSTSKARKPELVALNESLRNAIEQENSNRR